MVDCSGYCALIMHVFYIFVEKIFTVESVISLQVNFTFAQEERGI